MANISSSNSLGERVPKLRFPGFEGEWDSSPMGELGTFTKGAPLTKADITETGTPLILYGELYTTYGDIANTIVRKTDKDVKSECYSILGDVIIPTSGESPEEISTCTCVMQDGVILAGDLNIYRTNNVDGRFLSYEINHIRDREIAKIAQGKSIVHIRADELAKIVIRFPQKAEQSKIIEIFSYLDKKIELQKELLEALKLYKRGLLARLFPQKGAKQPELRIPGFTGNWEHRKFGDLGSVSMCKRIFKEQTSTEGDIPFYKIGTFGGKPDSFISRDVFEKYKVKFQYPEIGDVLISASGTIGRTVEYKGEEAYFQDSNIIWFKHDERVDNSFLKCIYAYVKWSGIEGSTIKRLYNDNFLKTEFWIPTVEEQQKIGAYFQHFDRLITLYHSKLKNFETIRNGLLQKLLI